MTTAQTYGAGNKITLNAYSLATDATGANGGQHTGAKRDGNKMIAAHGYTVQHRRI